MRWMTCLAVGLAACHSRAEAPSYQVIDFERRQLPDAYPDLADMSVPDLPGVIGVTIGDRRERPWGQYCGILWQAAYPLESRNNDNGGWWIWDAVSLQRMTHDETGMPGPFRWYPTNLLDGLPSFCHVAANYGGGQEWTWRDPPETWRNKCTSWFETPKRLAGLWLYQTGNWEVRLRTLDGRATEPVTVVQKWVWVPVGWELPEGELGLFVFIQPKYHGGWVIDNLVLGDDPPDPANLGGGEAGK